MTDKLTKVVAEMKESFFQQFGRVPDMLLIPRRADFVKEFAEGLHVATNGEAGSAPLIFHRLWVENAQCWFLELELFVSDEVDDLTPDINMDPDDMAVNREGRIIH